jgi:hypothetical protein
MSSEFDSHAAADAIDNVLRTFSELESLSEDRRKYLERELNNLLRKSYDEGFSDGEEAAEEDEKEEGEKEEEHE